MKRFFDLEDLVKKLERQVFSRRHKDGLVWRGEAQPTMPEDRLIQAAKGCQLAADILKLCGHQVDWPFAAAKTAFRLRLIIKDLQRIVDFLDSKSVGSDRFNPILEKTYFGNEVVKSDNG